MEIPTTKVSFKAPTFRRLRIKSPLNQNFQTAILLIISGVEAIECLPVWRFLGDFFEDMVTGGKKYLKLLSLSTT